MCSGRLSHSLCCSGESPISRLFLLRQDSQQSLVGGSEGPSSAAGDCTLLRGKFSETMQRCEDKQSNFRVWNESKEAGIGCNVVLFYI